MHMTRMSWGDIVKGGGGFLSPGVSYLQEEMVTQRSWAGLTQQLLNQTTLSLVPSRKKIIHLVTLHTILDTHTNLHTFRQEFERTNRNAAFFNHCNSEDRKCELQMHLFTILASVWLQLCQLTP